MTLEFSLNLLRIARGESVGSLSGLPRLYLLCTITPQVTRLDINLTALSGFCYRSVVCFFPNFDNGLLNPRKGAARDAIGDP